MLGLGTKKGEFLLYDFLKRDPYMKQMFQDENVTQIGHLPPEIKDAKKFIIYVLTDRNLYCLVKQRNILDKFIDSRSAESSPDRGFSKSNTQEALGGLIHRNSVYSTYEIDEMVPMSETSENSASVHDLPDMKEGEAMKTATGTIQRYSAESIEAM
jgi:hypothetical protein